MTAEQSGVFDVEGLRREFDAAFALPRGAGGRAELDFLLIRAGGRPYAVALAEVGGVLAGVAVTAVPSAAPGLLGVAGLRGDIVPVFELAALVGDAGASEARRWLLLSAGAAPIGFAFGVLEGHVRRRREELIAASGDGDGLFAGAIERDGYWPVVGVERLAVRIRERSTRARQGKEA
jgi:purine-binding chemotaxis protein CheW